MKSFNPVYGLILSLAGFAAIVFDKTASVTVDNASYLLIIVGLIILVGSHEVGKIITTLENASGFLRSQNSSSSTPQSR